MIESSLDCIIVTDTSGQITKTNKAFQKLVMYDEKEVMGIHIAEFTPKEEGRHESTTGELIELDEEFFNSLKIMVSKLIEEGKIKNIKTYLMRKDKKIVPVENSVTCLYNEKGERIGATGIIRDITERKKIEIENAELFEKTQNALEELKKTQSYLLQSEKMASIGQLAAGVAHEINNPIGFVHSNLNSLNKYINKVLELIKRYEEGITAFKNNGHKEIVSFCEEIDELKKKLKIDFIIKDFQKVVSDSLEGTQRINKIVADLKNFSRVGQKEFNHSNINEGLETTLNVVWNELKYKCTVEKEYGDLPQIYCNAGQLNQVFMNLLLNAAQAIETKGTITIATRYLNGRSTGSNKEQDYIEVKISDTGHGIPEETLKRIFDPFFTTKDVGKGTGLGLSIAYDIIQRHKGEITVQSEIGKGTTFTIMLPLLNAETTEKELKGANIHG